MNTSVIDPKQDRAVGPAHELDERPGRPQREIDRIEYALGDRRVEAEDHDEEGSRP